MLRRILFASVACGLAAAGAPTTGLAQDDPGSVVLESSSDAGASEGLRYVFAGVGIDTFATPARWPHLKNAVSDVQGVQQVLADRYGFVSPDAEGDWVLTNREATRESIYAMLEERLPAAIGSSDALVFFYAGHGTEWVNADSTVRQGYLVPHSVTKGIEARNREYVSLSDVVELLRALPARHVLLILDSCQSGLALTGLKDDPSTQELNLTLEQMLEFDSRMIVTSAQSNQNAADGNGPLEGHSLFTGHLVQALERAADGVMADSLRRVERNRVPAESLFEYVRDRVATRGGNQTPAFGGFLEPPDGGNPRGQFVFAFDLRPFDEAFAQAEALRLDQDYEGFRQAVDRALEDEEERDGPRARYLEWRVASFPKHVDVTRMVQTLRQLMQYVRDGVAVPVQDVAQLLATAEDFCDAVSCPAARPPAN